MLSKRSFTLSGHRTSVALEPEFWTALTRLAALEGRTIAQLVVTVDAARVPGDQLASSLRVMALRRAHDYSVPELSPAERQADRGDG